MFYAHRRIKIAIMVIIICLLFQESSVFAFPGDHNSLTCDKNFIGLTVNVFDNVTKTFVNKVIEEDIKDASGNPTGGILFDYYRKRPDQLTDDNFKKSRANIIAAINADIAKPHDQSIVKQKIRANHDATYEGKPLQVTKWGDSLSDFVNFYGVLTPSAVGNAVAPVGGIYGGSPLWIDSWSDYFSIWGQPPLVPVYVRNYGIATYTTTGVMDLMGYSSYYDGNNGW